LHPLKILKTFLFVFALLASGAFVVGKIAVQSHNGGDVMRQMNLNNYVLVVIVLAVVSLGFALLNSAMDAEKKRREEHQNTTSKNS
jgi:hypothetical protein